MFNRKPKYSDLKCLTKQSEQQGNTQRYDITPVPCPRMTRKDVVLVKMGKPQPRVARYFAFREEVTLKKVKVSESGCSIKFILPMPKSWSKKKKALYNNKPHQQVPDIDNLLKALLDSIYDNDCCVWNIGGLSKIWGYEGAIEIRNSR